MWNYCCRIKDADLETKKNFLSHWVDAHINDGDSLLKKPVLLTEVGFPIRMNKQENDINKLLKIVYDRISESANKGEAGAGALIWQLVVEGVEDYSDQYSFIAWDYPSTYELITQQSCRLRRIFSPSKTKDGHPCR